MRRRSLLATLASGTTVGLSGCLAGKVVIEEQVQETIPPQRGWFKEITGVDGSGAVSYEIRSEDSPFWVFYFTDPNDFSYYREQTLGAKSNQKSTESSGRVPTGHQELSTFARRNKSRGVYEAVMPKDGGKYSLKITGTHYLVVDYSNYGMGMSVPENAEPLTVTISLEVVNKHF